MNLPLLFKNRMKEILGEKANDYFIELEKPALVGVRTNLLKLNSQNLEKFLNLNNKSNFCDYLYITKKSEISGNNPLHHAGAFYFQEPSASSAVEALNPKPNDRVLDMCAAPGGKSTQIAGLIGEDGLLWSNEVVTSRVQALISNIERMGIKNAVVSNTHPDVLSEKLEGFFDKVLVDAPCSGEGMIRKDPSILKTWGIDNILACSLRQQKILESAAKCVKNGGYLCYSTCTFAPEENEMVIAKFLQNHNEFSLQKIEKPFGTNGIKKYAKNIDNIEYARRIFPFHNGEGHFVALMKKQGLAQNIEYSEQEKETENIKIFKEFFKENFVEDYKGIAIEIGNKVYIKPNIPTFQNIGVVRMGLYCGEIIKNRFVPSHALFTASGMKSKREVNLTIESDLTSKFLHGEVIPCDENIKGFTAVTLHGIPLGFGKAVNGILKNHYPKGLRIL